MKKFNLLEISLLIIVFQIVVAMVWTTMYKIGIIDKLLYSGSTNLRIGSTCTMGKNQCKAGAYCFGLLSRDPKYQSASRCIQIESIIGDIETNMTNVALSNREVELIRTKIQQAEALAAKARAKAKAAALKAIDTEAKQKEAAEKKAGSFGGVMKAGLQTVGGGIVSFFGGLFG